MSIKLPSPKQPDALAENPSPVEIIKDSSDYLRGDITDGLTDNLTGAIGTSDQTLIKFHGIYQQDNRDVRMERAARKLEPDYSFMLRLRIPGGLITPAQWLAVNSVANELTETGSIRLTTRQTLQFHGIPKENLRSLVATCEHRLLDSIAACGDVNRNVMCTPHAELSPTHTAAYDIATAISRRLLPATRAYYEIWLGEENLTGGITEEPLYGKHYLPRKFKIGIAIPPSNDIDVYSQDIGFVSVVKNNSLHGFNIIIGGGLGMTHSDTRTYPRVGDDIGFCTPKQAIDVAWHLVAIQRDYGNRSDRKLSRFKYTVARLGAATIKAELDKRLGFALEPSVPVQWMHRGDYLGWHRRPDGKWDLTLFVENGRLAAETSLKNALSEAAALDCCSLLITPNQNIMLINIADSDRIRVEAVFSRRKLSIEDNTTLSGLRRNAMACVSMPTCPLAMAEAERYMPTLLTRLENEVTTLNLRQNDIIIRMTGCPNGCARPYLGEIGLVGKSPGRYNLYLGASYGGDRLSSLVGKNLNEEGIVAFLRPLLEKYANQRQDDERFGDFLVRTGHVKAPQCGADFHP